MNDQEPTSDTPTIIGPTGEPIIESNPEPEPNPILTCYFCGLEDDLEHAMEIGWTPCFHRGEIEIMEPVCHGCLAANCHLNEEHGDWETKDNAFCDRVVAEIAKRILRIADLETRNVDDLDFHQVAVWSVKEALAMAFEAGRGAFNGICIASNSIGVFNLDRLNKEATDDHRE
jgi:hypothetical protein